MMHTLVMLSGGPDSVAAAWNAAQAGPVLLVHMRLSLHPGARRAEGRAARATAAWISEHTDHPVRYAELAYAVPREVRLGIGDMDHCAWPRAAFLAACPEIGALARCAVAEDVASGWLKRAAHYREAVEIALDGIRDPDWRWTDPLGWPPPPKAGVLDVMPPELREMAVSCRQSAPSGAPCGECDKCLGDRPGSAPAGVFPAPPPRPRDWGWDRLLLLDPDRLWRRDIRELKPRTLALLPHPDRKALATACAGAERIAQRHGIEIAVEPLWLPGLRRAVPAPAWPAAREAAARILAGLWLRTNERHKSEENQR